MASNSSAASHRRSSPALAESAWLAYPVVRNLIVPPRDNPAQRGRALAAQLGCFNCHGPGGTGGVPNPGSKTGEVPSFHEGTIMMYAHDDQDLREYILDGAPAAKLRAPRIPQPSMRRRRLRMPAFRAVSRRAGRGSGRLPARRLRSARAARRSGRARASRSRSPTAASTVTATWASAACPIPDR